LSYKQKFFKNISQECGSDELLPKENRQEGGDLLCWLMASLAEKTE
jgi:hypothetical protein